MKPGAAQGSERRLPPHQGVQPGRNPAATAEPDASFTPVTRVISPVNLICIQAVLIPAVPGFLWFVHNLNSLQMYVLYIYFPPFLSF